MKKFLKHIKYDDQFAASDGFKVESKPQAVIREALRNKTELYF